MKLDPTKVDAYIETLLQEISDTHAFTSEEWQILLENMETVKLFRGDYTLEECLTDSILSKLV